ncbi:hypothetical protein KC19_2G126900 [Ceratodon purpureus]|uniref:Germin-like protein n=1 Tax=Ceratodon purpureus TaxID=3225 RepID=A0A8T0IT66_CERPU|nr:hypothetical protein KC19_2G126900 [Ceratodon purpureus]
MAQSSSTTVLSLLFIALCAAASFMSAVHAADPDPLQDYCVADVSANAPLLNGYACKPRSEATDEDFTFTGFRKAPKSDSEIAKSPTGAIAVLTTPLTYPGINTQGITHARLDFAVGGVTPLHTHPRAAETIFILKGTVYTGFISDDNKLFASTLKQGDVFVFPKGLSHFQINVGKETAISFNTLTSQSPGFLVTANQIFQTNITSAVIEKSFGIDADLVKKLTATVPNFAA